MLFSGVRFWPPVSSALKELQIQTPTPIQSAAIAPLTAGVSCILHAETGSGKTLCYLLPLLKRLSSQEGTMDTTPIQAMIIVPTKELAVQVAADLNSLTAEFQRHEEQSLIHLCISTSNRKLDSIKSPILVGTPFKLLDLIKEASYGDRRSLQALRYIVVDEVDRLLLVPGRYASNDVLKSAKNEPTPTSQLLELLITSRGGLEKANIQVSQGLACFVGFRILLLNRFMA